MRGPWRDGLAGAAAALVGLLVAGCGTGSGSDSGPPKPREELADPLSPLVGPELPLPVGQVLDEIESFAPEPDIDDELWVQLTGVLIGIVKAPTAGVIAPHAPDTALGGVTDLELTQGGEADWQLTWSYVNAGDYNQDGLVSVSDLTPVGQHFGARSGQADWPAAQFADGNHDGAITLSDITPIGVNYLSQVDSYVLQCCVAGAEEEYWSELSTREFRSGIQLPAEGRLAFALALPIYHEDLVYRVRPCWQGEAGIPSNLVGAQAPDGRGDWWMYRHDPQHSGRSNIVGPQTGRVKWSYTIGTCFPDSIPVFGADGTIFVGGEDGEDLDALYAINPDGSLQWMINLRAPPTFDYYSICGTSAVALDGTIYVPTERAGGCLFAINPDGSLKWVCTFLPDSVTPYTSSPAIGDDGTIYIGAGCSLYAIDSDGHFKWSYDTSGAATSPAIGADGTIYVSDTRGMFYALAPDCSLLWANRSYAGWTPVIGPSGEFCTGSGQDPVGGDGQDTYRYGGLLAVGVDQKVYMPWGTSADLKYLGVYDSNGNSLYSYHLGHHVSDPIIGGDGTVYVGCEQGTPPEGKLNAISPENGLQCVCITGSEAPVGLVIGEDGTLYAKSGDNLLAIGE